MNINLLNKEEQDFIRDYKGDLALLAFKGSPFSNISIQELVQQIDSRNKIKNKLPTWYATSGILYPPKLNLEQTSSETTAAYKSSLVSGKILADITGGFGVDTRFFSDKFSEVHYFEIDPELAEIAQHNFKVFQKDNIKTFVKDGLQAGLTNKYDVIFVDPSRRHESKGKVVLLEDCEPNIPQNVATLLDNCELLIVKNSPMLDISSALQELPYIHEVHVVAVRNEVKELLLFLRKSPPDFPQVKTVNFKKNKVERFDSVWGSTAVAEYALPEEYLYEPNAAIFKSGAFDLISERFSLKKIHKNTHLYTDNKLIDFPGRRFKIENIVPYSKSGMRLILPMKKANISIRNFPETVAVLRKKWKIADGGDTYLFFITNMENKKQVLICSKL